MDDHARATARSHGSASDADAPAPRVIVLTVYAGDDDIRRALAAGAAGYLLEDAAGADVIGAIRAVTRGELEVLTLIAAGCRNRESAERIGRTEETVKMHVKSVLAKLGARDRTGAVNAALKRGFLHIP
jgi:two-component system NarL family response regulator